MRAALFAGAGKQLELGRVPRPDPGAGEALLRVRACGICGSDLHASQVEGMVRPGAIMGHEFAGEISELGPDPLGDWRVGDRVFSLASFTCGRCEECLRGRSHFCRDGTYIGELGPDEKPGAYAEYVLASTNDLVRLPDDVGFEVGALLEPLSTAMVSVRLAELRPNARVLILGGGPIGIAIAHVCSSIGVMRIAVSEPTNHRRELAGQLGATGQIDPTASEDLGAAVREALGAEPDVVFEAVGRPGMLNAAIAQVRRQGTVIAAGICLEPDTFDHFAAYPKEPTIRVPCYYTIDDAHYLVEMLRQGRLDPSPMVTHSVALDQLPDSFESLRKPSDQVKVIVAP
jgi:(R,R)-butanediol dehydrogenase / meso-butanediol dehydrogenase / diacetyl reductase